MFNQENVLIPFSVSELPKGPWLVFAPHADDETFGMGGTLLKAKQQGIKTHLVVLTDGALGGDAPDLIKVRQEEVTIASKLLGFSSLHLWSAPDRSLYLNEEIINKAKDIISLISPASVFFPAVLEIHPDHRATAYIVWESLRQHWLEGKFVQPISYEIGVQSPINFLIDITEQQVGKNSVMHVYKSQNEENNYPELVTALDRGRTFSLPQGVDYAEGFFQYEIKDLEQSIERAIHSSISLYLKLN